MGQEPVPQTTESEPAELPSAEVESAEAEEETYSVDELESLRANEVAFQWQASEFVHHRKGNQWYIGLAALVALMLIIAVMSQYWLEIGLFVLMGVAVLVYARKPPRVLTYELTPVGIAVDGRMHPYGQFRSFGVAPDIEWHTIDLEPVGRLSPRLSILFDEQYFDQIVGHLELHLPRVDRNPDVVERLSRYVRF